MECQHFIYSWSKYVSSAICNRKINEKSQIILKFALAVNGNSRGDLETVLYFHCSVAVHYELYIIMYYLLVSSVYGELKMHT